MNFTVVLSLVNYFDQMVNEIKFINSQLQILDQGPNPDQQSSDLTRLLSLSNAARTGGGGPFADDDDLVNDAGPVEEPGWTLFEQIVLLTILILTGLLTIAGNVLVVLSVALEKSLRSVSNYFLASLSAADLIVGVLMMPVAAYLEVRPNFSNNSEKCIC